MRRIWWRGRLGLRLYRRGRVYRVVALPLLTPTAVSAFVIVVLTSLWLQPLVVVNVDLLIIMVLAQPLVVVNVALLIPMVLAGRLWMRAAVLSAFGLPFG